MTPTQRLKDPDYQQAIRDYYDKTPNLTLAQLAQITGLSVAQLKKVLMP